MTDETILQLAKQSHTREEGFRQLVRTYQQRLYHVIRRQVHTHEDADDVLQNTFLKVFRHLESFEGRSGLFTWMYRIAQNEVINFVKQNDKYKAKAKAKAEAKAEAGTEAKDEDEVEVRFVGTSAPVSVHQPVEYDVNMERLAEDLEIAINRLPERQRMVFRMRYYDEMSYKEMAGMLEITEGALKASFHHAVKKITEELRAQQWM
jgi:RNA polymerase sigma-70 factor (ECF subfamily)